MSPFLTSLRISGVPLKVEILTFPVRPAARIAADGERCLGGVVEADHVVDVRIAPSARAWTFGWIFVATSAIVTSVNFSLQPLQYFANSDLIPRHHRHGRLDLVDRDDERVGLAFRATIAWSAIKRPGDVVGDVHEAADVRGRLLVVVVEVRDDRRDPLRLRRLDLRLERRPDRCLRAGRSRSPSARSRRSCPAPTATAGPGSARSSS